MYGFILLEACSSKSSESIDIETINIQVSEVIQNTPAFEHFDFIKLEMTPESTLPDIAKVVMHDDKIYILSMFDARVFIFSNTGQYINSLRKGQGPGEVIFVSDMAVIDNNLYVLDNYRNIHKYDMEGNYISDVFSSEEPYFSFKYTDFQLILFDPCINKKSDYMLRLISNGRRTDILSKERTLKNVNFIHYNFYNNDYISWPLCDTIYQYKESSIFPKYVVRFDKKNFFDIKKSQTYTFDEMCKMNQDKTYCRWICDVMPYDKGLYFAYRYDKPYFVRYEDGKINIYSRLAKELPKTINASVGIDGSKIIYTCRTEDLIAYKSEIDNNEKLNHTIYNSLNEDDNPLLLIFDLNK